MLALALRPPGRELRQRVVRTQRGIQDPNDGLVRPVGVGRAAHHPDAVPDLPLRQLEDTRLVHRETDRILPFRALHRPLAVHRHRRRHRHHRHHVDDLPGTDRHGQLPARELAGEGALVGVARVRHIPPGRRHAARGVPDLLRGPLAERALGLHGARVVGSDRRTAQLPVLDRAEPDMPAVAHLALDVHTPAHAAPGVAGPVLPRHRAVRVRRLDVSQQPVG